jgi:uncharacterized protein YoxC
MVFTVADFDDFARLLGEHPEWREKLRPLILGEELLVIPSRMDRVEAALLTLTERVDRLTERVDRLTERVDRLTERVEQLTQRVDQLSQDVRSITVTVAGILARMDRMDGRMGNIEGQLLETRFEQNLPNWVRNFVRKPTRVHADDVAQIEQAVADGTLTESDADHLAALDSLIRGLGIEDGEETYLAVELSFTVNAEDVERAESRANMLKRAGLRARPFVGGYRISPAAESMLEERGVLVSLRRVPA